eukprot:Em0006g861a
MIEKSHADGQDAAIKIALHSSKQEECKTHSRDRLPRFFTAGEEGTLSYVPCARLRSTEHNLITFYSLSSATVKCVLTGEHIRRDFPFKVWHEEHDIINQPYGKTAIVLIGRSGTGKTTCCLYRLWNQFHSYWICNRVESPVLTRGLMVSTSAHPETVEKSANTGASSIANASPLDSYEKKIYDLAAGSECCKLHVPFEDYCIPTCLEDVEDLAYPLFITAHQFYVILDNSLGDDKTFFPHLEDGTLNVRISSSDYDQGNEESLLDLDDSDTEDDLSFERHDERTVDQTKLQSSAKKSLTEISSLYFVQHIWPEIRKKSSSPDAKKLDPLLVWMEIKSTIKGSVQAMNNDKGYLSLEEYEEVGKKMAPHFVGKRADIYELFEYYQEYIKQQRYNSLFDECDLLHCLHQRLSQLKGLQWSIHHFYIDEVQDFTQAELALFVRTCREPNGLFLTGDSAQSIMRGIAFRFSDVRTIFYEMQQNLTRNRGDVTQVRTPNIAQLTINFRSHTGILNLASSVIDLLKYYFPSSFDHLPCDQGMFVGPMPVLLYTCVASDLALLLRGNKRGKSQIEFGAHQAIIVQSEAAKSQIPEELQGAIVLTVFESKGLEFDDVLLYNVFHDSVVDKEWRVVSEFLEHNSDLVKNKERIFQQPRSLQFDELQHKSLNSELKYLYTAITRAKCNLWIYDCNEHKRLPLFDYWLRRNLVKVVTSYDSVTNEETLFNHASDPEEWRKQGEYFRKKDLWEAAMKCYHKAGDKHLEMEAKAFSLLKKIQSTNKDESHKLYYMAAIAFLDSDEAKHDPSKEQILYAAKCLKNARNHRNAAELYRLLGKHDGQISIKSHNWRDGERDQKEIPKTMNSMIDEKLQDVQEEKVLQIDAGNQKIDEEVEEWDWQCGNPNLSSKTWSTDSKGSRRKRIVCLGAGHGVVLEREIQEDTSGNFAHLIGIPKALLPASGGVETETILDCWWSALKSRQQFEDVYLVTNADKSLIFTSSVMEIQQCKVKSTFPARIAPFSVPLGRMEAVQGLRKARFERETWTYFALLYLHNGRGSYLEFEPLALVTSTRSKVNKKHHAPTWFRYKYYERWASSHEFPISNILNNGSTTLENSHGAIADLNLVIQCKHIKRDVMVVAGDMLFNHNFEMGQVVDYFRLKKGSLAIYYELTGDETTQHRGIVEVDESSGRITKFLEKPQLHETTSRKASPVFYCLKKESLPLISTYCNQHFTRQTRTLGKFMEWFVTQTVVYGMKLPTKFQLIGQIGLAEYRQWTAWFSANRAQLGSHPQPIMCRCYARIGLIGNPSDGYFGKTISVSISNFWADVTITESSRLKLAMHPLNDPTEFGSLSDLYGTSLKEGYLGGLRLLQATCKRFYQYCAMHGIALARRNFTLRYDTNIPRQVGLAGSSAIITATLKCLMRFYNLTEKACDIPKPLQPTFVLDVEKSELFIQAGLQDRVVQVYEGLVYMDFSKSIMDSQGHGMYEHLPIGNLPPLWLAYLADPSDSGKIHSNVKQRWLQGDHEVIEAMQKFAELTDKAKLAIESKDHESLANLMDQNFDLRRKLYGDEVIGEANLLMVEIARKHGSSAKFPGSGGAVIGVCRDPSKKPALMQEMQECGFVFCDTEPYFSSSI